MGCLPLLFAALTGRSGHGLARSKMLAPPIRSASKQVASVAVADLKAIFKAYDIRGVVGEQIDAEACRVIGAAFGWHVRSAGGWSVVLGRDMRPDGVELSGAFAHGVLSAGVDVVDLGLCATEMVYFASGVWNMPGAMFTASHNPVGYNGIKLCGSGATPIGSGTGLEEIERQALAGPPPAPFAGQSADREILEQYVAHVLSFVDVAALRPLRVVVDTANGMGGLVVPAVFESLPFELDLLYPELDGTFPNHPADPLEPDNLRDLQARVVSTSADVGLAFDGDADRVFAVDESARPLSGSLTAALVARVMLEREPGAAVVHNLICSAGLPEAIAQWGGTAVRSRVGHTFMKQVMGSSGAVFGGEHSGHYYFRDNYRADSAMIAAVVLLEALSRSGGTLSELAAPLQRYAASGEINTRAEDPGAVIERVADAFAEWEQDRLDGLTVDCGDWWFNLRPSNTEPLLRLNLEAATPAEVRVRVAEVRAMLTGPVVSTSSK